MEQSAGREVGSLPLVIGVSGHRDLPEDTAELQKQVRAILQDLRTNYPSTPLVLLSPLAEGADRLVAHIALQMEIRLVVPLPMPKAEYVRDFESEDSKKDFNELLSRAEPQFELSQVQNVPSEEVSDRERSYVLVGAYIARHSQILLALWNGEDEGKPAGTARIVQFKLEGVPPPYGPPRSPLDPPESGPVFHLVTPRRSSSNTVGEPFRLQKRYPKGYQAADAEAAYERIFRRMDGFNADEVRLSSRLKERREGEKKELIPDDVADMPAPFHSALSRYARASSLALHYQVLSFWSVRALAILALLAAAVFQVYSILQPKPLWLAVGYSVVLSLAYLLYSWSRYIGDYHNKYLDYRALAEGLRVLLFWRMAGLRHEVADHYLRRQRGPLAWIRQAIRVWTIPAKADLGQPVVVKPREDWLKEVVKRWVEHQRDFFASTAPRDKLKATVIGVLGYGFFLAGLALAFIKLALDQNSPVLLAMSLTMVVAAVLAAYARIMGYFEHATQYDRMGKFFATGYDCLNSMLAERQYDEAQALIRELGQEALTENGEWLVYHSRNAAEPPGSGP